MPKACKFSFETNLLGFFFFSLYPVTILLRFVGAKSYASSFYQLTERRQIACKNCPLFSISIPMPVFKFSALEYQMDLQCFF